MLQARIHRWLAAETRFSEGLLVAERHAQASLEIAEGLDDTALLAGALSMVANTHFHLGEPDALRLAERSYELAVTAGDPEVLAEVTQSVSSTLLWTGRLDRARRLLEGFYTARKELDEHAVAVTLWRLSLVEFYAGRFALQPTTPAARGRSPPCTRSRKKARQGSSMPSPSSLPIVAS